MEKVLAWEVVMGMAKKEEEGAYGAHAVFWQHWTMAQL